MKVTKNTSKTLLLLATVFIAIILYHKNLIWLGHKWINDPDYSHGPLIPLISVYIGWLKREKLSKIKNDSGYLSGLAIVAFAIVLQIVSIRANVNLASSYSFIIIIAIVVIIGCSEIPPLESVDWA